MLTLPIARPPLSSSLGIAILMLVSLQGIAEERNQRGAETAPAPRVAESNEQRLALVIGNASYKSMPLSNPVNDARAVAAKLRTLDFEVIEYENVTHDKAGAILREFRSRLKPGAVALFFYAGHGVQVNGINYLPLVDADISSEEDVPLQSLSLNHVIELMDQAKTRLNLVFLDACRNNPFARSFRASVRGLAKVDAPSGTMISFATRPGSVASDGARKNGLYTEYLLANIDLANEPVEQVLKRVVRGVKEASKGNQQPWMEGSIEGDFFFKIADNEPSPELQLWDSIKTSDRASDYRRYLERFPNGQFAALATSRLSALTEAPQVPPSAPVTQTMPATQTTPGTGVSAALGSTREGSRLLAIQSIVRSGQLAGPLSPGEANAILNGMTGSSRAKGIAEIAHLVPDGLTGRDGSTVLGTKKELNEGPRYEAIQALVVANKFGPNSTDTSLILDGTTGSTRARAIAQLAPSLRGALSAKEVSAILGDRRELNEGNRVQAIEALVHAQKIKQALTGEEIALIVEGTTGSSRSRALAALVSAAPAK